LLLDNESSKYLRHQNLNFDALNITYIHIASLLIDQFIAFQK